MSKINYELVYVLHPAEQRIFSAERKLRSAQGAVEEAKKIYQKAIEAVIGTNDFEVTNVACMANNISHHVYTPNVNITQGLGNRKCIYCGADNFSI